MIAFILIGVYALGLHVLSFYVEKKREERIGGFDNLIVEPKQDKKIRDL